MEPSTGGPSTEPSTRLTCSFCGKPGHKEEKCWVKSPEQKKAYIKKRYGRDFKKGILKRNDPSASEDGNPSVDLPIQVTGPFETRPQRTTISKSDNKPNTPLAKKKINSRSRRQKRSSSIDYQPELVFFGPSDKTA
jgi:hypothetical protein